MSTTTSSAAPSVSPHRKRPHRSFKSIFLAPKGDGSRRRSGTDAVKLIVSVIIFVVLWVGISSRVKLQTDVANALHPPAQGISWLVTGLWWATTAGTVLLVLGAALISRRAEIYRDLGLAAALALGSSLAIQWTFGEAGRFPASDQQLVPGVDLHCPVLSMSTAVAVIFASLPYLSRHLQRFLQALVGVALLSGMMKGVGLPVSLISSVDVGWGVVAIVHLIFGSPTGVPEASDVGGLLAELGVEADRVAPLPRQEWGLARFGAVGRGGSSLRISLYGRDARDSQLLSKLYRTIMLRNDVGPFVMTRSQQVDHECYLGLLAADAAPGATSSLVTSGFAGGSSAGIVVVEVPRARTLGELLDEAGRAWAAKEAAAVAAAAEAAAKEETATGKKQKVPLPTAPAPIPADVQEPVVSEAALRSMAGIVVALQAKDLSHGAIDPDRIVIDGDQAVLLDFDRARTHAPEESKQLDTAAMLTAMALAAGSEKATSIGLEVFGKEQLASALGLLQDAALPKFLVAALRKQKGKRLLKELRAQGAVAAGVEEPKSVELRRVSWTNLILIIGTFIGGWALIGVFLNVANSFSTIENAQWAWVAATAVLAPFAYLGSAISSLGSILVPLPLLPLVVLELSNTFSGLALGTPAVMAARIRFFQKQGVDTTIAVSSGVLVSTASWIVKGGLFLLSIPFALGDFSFKGLTQGKSGATQGMLLLIVIVVVGVGLLLAIVFGVPRFRRMVAAKLLPRLREVIDHFKVLVGRPLKLVEIFGGMLIAQIVTAMALGTSLHAFGEHLSLPVIIIVITLGSVLGGVSPVPGGMGVVEAGMILGLRAAGIPTDQAVAAVFVQRLFTAYLPPLFGWFALMWLRRKEYL